LQRIICSLLLPRSYLRYRDSYGKFSVHIYGNEILKISFAFTTVTWIRWHF